MLRSSNFLLNVRVWFYSLGIAHLVLTALVVFPIDMSKDKDPRISAYNHVRWKLLTCWFNLITLAYFPVCLYCDWRERRGEWDLRHVTTLRKIKDYVMTSILFPTTLFADLIFWRMWHKDLSLIAPPRIFDYLPYWTQHSLHTVSLVMMILDLLLVPRRRPCRLWPGITLMLTFLFTYLLVCSICLLNGEVVYSLFLVFDKWKLILLTIMTVMEYLFYYLVQWCVIDLVWGRQSKIKAN